MKPPNQEIVTIFRVTSEHLNGREIANMINIPSGLLWNKGDFRPHTKSKYTTSGWMVSFKKNEYSELGELVSSFLNWIQPHKEFFLNLDNPDIYKELSIVFYSEVAPAASLTWELMAELAQFKINLDVDIYIMPAVVK